MILEFFIKGYNFSSSEREANQVLKDCFIEWKPHRLLYLFCHSTSLDRGNSQTLHYNTLQDTLPSSFLNGTNISICIKCCSHSPPHNSLFMVGWINHLCVIESSQTKNFMVSAKFFANIIFRRKKKLFLTTLLSKLKNAKVTAIGRWCMIRWSGSLSCQNAIHIKIKRVIPVWYA